MKHTLAFVFAVVFAAPAPAQDDGATIDEPLFVSMNEVNLADFKWKKRPVVVFAESDLDPAFEDQMRKLRARQQAAIEIRFLWSAAAPSQVQEYR